LQLDSDLKLQLGSLTYNPHQIHVLDKEFHGSVFSILGQWVDVATIQIVISISRLAWLFFSGLFEEIGWMFLPLHALHGFQLAIVFEEWWVGFFIYLFLGWDFSLALNTSSDLGGCLGFWIPAKINILTSLAEVNTHTHTLNTAKNWTGHYRVKIDVAP
jgi:hypothetical protein